MLPPCCWGAQDAHDLPLAFNVLMPCSGAHDTPMAELWACSVLMPYCWACKMPMVPLDQNRCLWHGARKMPVACHWAEHRALSLALELSLS